MPHHDPSLTLMVISAVLFVGPMVIGILDLGDD